MDTTQAHKIASTPIGTPKRQTKKANTPAQRLEALEKKRKQLDARIQNEQAKIKADERKKDTRRKIIAGAIALENMTIDDDFRATMQRLISEHVKEKDRELFDL